MILQTTEPERENVILAAFARFPLSIPETHCSETHTQIQGCRDSFEPLH
jgi:hypothetical protein